MIISDGTGGHPVLITGIWSSGRGPDSDYVAHVFVSLCSNITCRLYKWTFPTELKSSWNRHSVFQI